MEDVTDKFEFSKEPEQPPYELIFNGRIWKLTAEDLNVKEIGAVSRAILPRDIIYSKMAQKLRNAFNKRDQNGDPVFGTSFSILRIEIDNTEKNEFVIYVQADLKDGEGK